MQNQKTCNYRKKKKRVHGLGQEDTLGNEAKRPIYVVI